MVACASSLFLLIGCLHANIFNASEAYRFIGSNNQPFLTWFEVRTIIYLKVSISDFLTLFSARTRGWFWERRLGKLLGIASMVALISSTIFALYWDSIFEKLGESAFMTGLRDSKGAVICVWLYCACLTAVCFHLIARAAPHLSPSSFFSQASCGGSCRTRAKC